MKKLKTIWGSFIFALSGCSSPDIQEYTDYQPKVTISEFFNGTLEGWGIFQDYTGKVVKQFTLKMRGEWTGNKGKLYETFYWNNNTTSERVWDLEIIGPNLVRAITPEVVGEGQGRSAGNTIQWGYTLKVPVDDTVYEFYFDDWMYAVTNDVIINKAKMKKFGLTLGEVTLCLKKEKS